MTAQTTTGAPEGFAQNVVSFAAQDVIPDALALTVGTQAGTVEGDQPEVLVPWVDDDDSAEFVDEGAHIDEDGVDLQQIGVKTKKLARLAPFSREQLAQPGASNLIVNAMKRGLIKSANKAFLGNPTGPSNGPTGILNLAELPPAVAFGTDLDQLRTVVAEIEDDGGQATHIITNPVTWSVIRNIKKNSTDSNEALDWPADLPPVLRDPGVPAGNLVVLDKGSLPTAIGPVLMARSDDYYFGDDAVAIRLTWRMGWNVRKFDRVRRMTVAAPVAG